ncbi:MAG: type II toxin-antitoxin system HicB family antitoxin [Synechococcales cyanobacterium C42_A2020_086]|jgi:predicted HicB family RNase H-like nuclease|nr:type II toxin-antitoxin system HicB family antitoxin [Synechococcales cyanobacterium M58_A2018_015]MBF2072243.1 type II toxin-antitoxin system HicB family antitoxin [Synechococcales cyanobacterium C42_A2020_086]
MTIYKGYTAEIDRDEETGVFHGRVSGIQDIVTFEGKTLEEAEREFSRSIDAYLRFCREIDWEPNPPTVQTVQKVPQTGRLRFAPPPAGQPNSINIVS